jgi:hypothetical protein
MIIEEALLGYPVTLNGYKKAAPMERPICLKVAANLKTRVFSITK